MIFILLSSIVSGFKYAFYGIKYEGTKLSPNRHSYSFVIFVFEMSTLDGTTVIYKIISFSKVICQSMLNVNVLYLIFNTVIIAKF